MTDESDEFALEVYKYRLNLVAFANKLGRNDLNEAEKEDIVSNSILKALANRNQFIAGTNLKAWLTTILKNEFLTYIRKGSKNQREIASSDNIEVFDYNRESTDILNQVIAKEELSIFDDVSDTHKDTLLQAALGNTYEKIAEKQRVAVGTIKSRISRGKEEFEKLIEQGKQEEIVEINNRYFRSVVPFPLDGIRLQACRSKPPTFMMVDPKKLLIEHSYQRTLTKKSIAFIKKTIANWNWNEYKAPNIARDQGRLFIIDGQHTCIAAASRPDVSEIPVLIYDISIGRERAKAFVALNSNRVAMTALDIYHGKVAAGDYHTARLEYAVRQGGGRFPKFQKARGKGIKGDLTNPNEWLSILGRIGERKTTELVSFVVKTNHCPMTRGLLRAAETLMFDEDYSYINKDTLLKAFNTIPDLENKGRTIASTLRKEASIGIIEVIVDWIQNHKQEETPNTWKVI